MFIDFVAILLINMAAGLVILSGLIYHGFDVQGVKKFAPGFAVVGIVGLVTSVPMVVVWPLPGSFNVAYGETSLLFASLWLVAAISMALNWDLRSLTIYAFFVGWVSVLIGVRFLHLRLSAAPELAAAGFIITGFCAIMSFPTLVYFKDNRALRITGALIVLAAAGIWGVTGLGAYWGHLEAFNKWTPSTMINAAPASK